MMDMLDLFSGIGGFSLAFRRICRTVAYCENDASCCDVLRRQMESGMLHKAQIFEDIRTLRAKDLKSSPEIVTMGSPCVDLSTAGLSQGTVMGSRSGLIFNAMGLIAELPSVRHVFLENSPNIVNRGLELVLSELTKLGFEPQWIMLSARQVGAPHQRRRWFCLASRKKLPTLVRRPILKKWPDESVPRFATCKKPDCRYLRKRLGMLGNAAVPIQILTAYYILSSLHHGISRKLPTCGGDLNLYMADGEREVNKKQWATPTAGISHWYFSKLSRRGADVLCVQIFYERGSRRQLQGWLNKKVPMNELTINPTFIEWMQGFPIGWTA